MNFFSGIKKPPEKAVKNEKKLEFEQGVSGGEAPDFSPPTPPVHELLLRGTRFQGSGNW